MSNLHVKYLLIGGGVASSEAARAIRARDDRGELMLISQEINRPYYRSPLSKSFLRGVIRRDELFTVSADWFVEHQVQLRTGRRAAFIDVPRSNVTLDNGEEISYDKLLIATGASPNALNVPGANLPNLFYLRTMDDAEQIFHAAEKARKEKRSRAVVIGGGPLGVEAAACLTQLGLTVDLVMSGPHPLHRIIGDATGRSLTAYLEKHGVNIHPSAPVIRLDGDGRVQRAVLADQASLDCAFCVAAVGTHVNQDLLRSTPIAAENAILVDDRCETNIPGIYAAGDCAAVRDRIFDKHRIARPCDTAADTGQIAGANIAGANLRYQGLSRFDGQMFDLQITGWGEWKQVDRRIIRGSTSADSPNFAEIGVARDSRIAQVIALGRSRDDRALPELVRRREKVDGNEQSLGDPDIALPET